MIVPIFEIHRYKKQWGPDAEEFNPDRFLRDDIHAYSWIPFSGGIRNCTGIKYAMQFIKIALCHLIQNYKFSTSVILKDLKFHISFDMEPVGGHMIKIEKRK